MLQGRFHSIAFGLPFDEALLVFLEDLVGALGGADEVVVAQVARLEQVFKLHGKDAKGVDCPAIDGIIEEAEEIAGDIDDKTVLDAGLIAAAQAVEHYEMTRYGSLVAWAKQLGRGDCASLLQQNLDEEKNADKKLTMIAESNINRKAA